MKHWDTIRSNGETCSCEGHISAHGSSNKTQLFKLISRHFNFSQPSTIKSLLNKLGRTTALPWASNQQTLVYESMSIITIVPMGTPACSLLLIAFLSDHARRLLYDLFIWCLRSQENLLEDENQEQGGKGSPINPIVA